jgi:hypothetical protein
MFCCGVCVLDIFKKINSSLTIMIYEWMNLCIWSVDYLFYYLHKIYFNNYKLIIIIYMSLVIITLF